MGIDVTRSVAAQNARLRIENDDLKSIMAVKYASELSQFAAVLVAKNQLIEELRRGSLEAAEV